LGKVKVILKFSVEMHICRKSKIYYSNYFSKTI